MRKFTFRVLMTLACLCPGTAFAADAADCRLKIVNTIPIELSENGSRVLVSVAINGTKEPFLLDTGGALTQISATTAKALNLPIADSNMKMLDMYGQAAVGEARVDTFALGRLQDRKTSLPMMTTTFDGQPYVGILAADYMGEYDVELDFRGGKMNYFSRDHCEGKVVYWPTAAIAAVPVHLLDNHLALSVTLDGRPIKAMIDTGSPDTVLTTEAAKQAFDLTADSPGAKQLDGAGNDRTFEYVFRKLSFEGLEVRNPHIVVAPDKIGSKDPNNAYVTGSRLHRVDDRDSGDPVMLIGMNILSKLHLYIAFSENKIYITPASAPAASTGPQ
jgi:predicted aspartyl protease